MDEEAKKKIALFRFSLIAPLLNQTFKESTAKAYIEEICARAYDVSVYDMEKLHLPQSKAGSLTTENTVLKAFIRLHAMIRANPAP